MTSTDAGHTLSGIIASVEAAEHNYQAVKENKTLGETFHEAARVLPHIYGALGMIEEQASTQITPSLKSCSTTAKSLEAVFKEVSREPAGDCYQVYVAYVENNGRGSLVEALVIGMFKHVREMIKDCTVTTKMQEQLAALQAAIDNLKKKEEPSVPEKQTATICFSNHGRGKQFNTTGGTQNNATGKALQFVGSTFSEHVYFGSNASNSSTDSTSSKDLKG